MHLTGITQKDFDEQSTTMTGDGVDVRLRRQPPVSGRPPKLRLGTRTRALSASRLHKKSDIVKSFADNENGNTDTSQCSGLSITNSQNSIGPTVLNDNDKSSSNLSLYKRGSVDSSNNNRPLIHHQRHNLKNRFQLLKTLGEGTYGKVKLAADRSSGEQVAIKYIKKTKIQDDHDLARIRREIQILSSLRHKHIVNIREVFEKKDKIVLVMDYAQGGELYEYLNKLGKLSECDARRVFRQIVSAIHYCHQNGVVHRDLKLENIILDDAGNVKIADFGLSNYYSHNNTLKTFCGSPLYASPEIVNGKPYHGPEVDVWSLGVILYTLVYGAMPFESNNLVSLKQQISDGDYNQPLSPSDAAGLIRHMLTVTPSRRATMEDALRHWWVNLGHAHMPNDLPYSPDDEPPVMPYTLSVDDSISLQDLPPPTVIHQRNQSSISSDSDVELDFRPLRWTGRRRLPLDSTGNSLSSSVAGSPAPTPDSSCGVGGIDDDMPEDAASIASGLLKLPPDVLEILKGCSSKSLAALLNIDKLSTGFDMEPSHESQISSSSDGSSCSTSSQCTDENLKQQSIDNDKSSPVFDSERKPKRSILKRKGKFSGGDSGCMVNEDMSLPRGEETPMPKAGHLPRRLPSFRDEANGIFASKYRATQLLEATDCNHHHQGCSSAVSETSWCHPTHTEGIMCSSEQSKDLSLHNPNLHHCHNSQSTPHNQADYHYHIHHHHPNEREHLCSSSSEYSRQSHSDNNNLFSQQTSDTMQYFSHSHLPLVPQSLQPSQTTHSPQSLQGPFPNDTINGNFECAHSCASIPAIFPTDAIPIAGNTDTSSPQSSPEGNVESNLQKETSRVSRRPKSILKGSRFSQLEEARNRLSISSIGSNSSADILDLSYDSGDSDHFINHEALFAGKSNSYNGRDSDYLDLVPSTRRVSPSQFNDSPVLDLVPTLVTASQDSQESHPSAVTGCSLSHSFEALNIKHGEILTKEGKEILDSKSSLLYRLTRDAQNLL